MNGLRTERWRIKEESAWQHQKTYSVGCYRLFEGLSQNLSPLLLWISSISKVDYTHHLQALQRRIFPACALATVVNEKSGHCQRCCAKKCPFVDSTPVSEIWPQNERVIQRRDRDRAPSRQALCSSSRGNWADILKRERKRKELEHWRW